VTEIVMNLHMDDADPRSPRVLGILERLVQTADHIEGVTWDMTMDGNPVTSSGEIRQIRKEQLTRPAAS